MDGCPSHAVTPSTCRGGGYGSHIVRARHLLSICRKVNAVSANKGQARAQSRSSANNSHAPRGPSGQVCYRCH